MREIKFRAWDGDKMYYNVQNTYDGHLADSFGDLLTMNQHIVVEQFTGLRDKNDKEIYEGDIVRAKALWPSEYMNKGETCIDEVAFNYGSFYIKGLASCARWGWLETEIIGNIHENPELLK